MRAQNHSFSRHGANHFFSRRAGEPEGRARRASGGRPKAALRWCKLYRVVHNRIKINVFCCGRSHVAAYRAIKFLISANSGKLRVL